MNYIQRIATIRRTRTPEQLDEALIGFHEQVIVVYPALDLNYAFNLAMERKQYFHALCDIKRAARGVWGGGYQDIIAVLEHAAGRQFSFPDNETVRTTSLS